MHTFIYSFYAYSFYMSGVLRWMYVESEHGSYTAGVSLAIIFNFIFGLLQLGKAVSMFKSISETEVAGQIAIEVIDRVPKVLPDEPGKKKLKCKVSDLQGRIEFKKVSFTYSGSKEKKGISHFTTVFEAGKTTALVGPSGSGKSTVLKLIERFYDADDGQILIDGRDIKDLHVESFRKMVGYVS